MYFKLTILSSCVFMRSSGRHNAHYGLKTNDVFSKTCVKRSLKNSKIDKTNILMTNCTLMKVESIAEILQYF